MGYSAENYRAVKEILERRRARALAECEERRARAHALSPALADIDEALGMTGIALFRAACEGGREGEAFARVKEENLALQEARVRLLDELSLPRDFTEVKYTCPDCADTGYRDIYMCHCMKRELVLAGLASSGLGRLLDTQSFDSFSLDYYAADANNKKHMARTLKIAREYADTFSLSSGNLIFFGRTGLGKTHLSTAIARVVIERGFDVCYNSAENILSDYEFDRYKSNFGKEEPRAEKYAATDLLIIDDLGTESLTQFALSALYNLINTRLSAGRPTIVSTNLGEGELQARYGDRIASRLLGEFRPLLFLGADIRAQKQE